MEIWINPACSKSRTATNALDEAGVTPTHRSTWIEAMATNPILIQRPVLTADDNTTAIARDPESLAHFLPS